MLYNDKMTLKYVKTETIVLSLLEYKRTKNIKAFTSYF